MYLFILIGFFSSLFFCLLCVFVISFSFFFSFVYLVFDYPFNISSKKKKARERGYKVEKINVMDIHQLFSSNRSLEK